jgi:hypothetical protein
MNFPTGMLECFTTLLSTVLLKMYYYYYYYYYYYWSYSPFALPWPLFRFLNLYIFNRTNAGWTCNTLLRVKVKLFSQFSEIKPTSTTQSPLWATSIDTAVRMQCLELRNGNCIESLLSLTRSRRKKWCAVLIQCLIKYCANPFLYSLSWYYCDVETPHRSVSLKVLVRATAAHVLNGSTIFVPSEIWIGSKKP